MNLRFAAIGRWAATAAFLVVAPAQAANWALFGPADGALVAVAGHPKSDGLFVGYSLASGPEGPALQPWLTLDNGARWRIAAPIDLAPSSRTFGTMAAGGAPSTIYIEVDGGLLRSDDEGTTWVPLDFGSYDASAVRLAGVNPLDGHEVLVIAGGRLLRSTDAGATWLPVGTFDAELATIDWFTRVAYLTTTSPPTVRSVLLANGAQVAVASFTATRLGADGAFALAVTPGNLYRSINNGVLWQGTLTEFGQVTFGGVAFAPSVSGFAYAWEQGGARRLWRTTNRGDSWTLVATAPCACEWTGILIGVSDVNRIVAATTAGAYLSNDGGATLTLATASNGLAGTARSGVLTDPGDKIRKWLTGGPSNRRPLTSDDTGATWKAVELAPDGDVARPVYVHPGIPGLVFAQGSTRLPGTTLWRSIDSGVTWKATLVFGNGTTEAVAAFVPGPAPDGNEIFVVLRDPTAGGSFTRVFRSLDAGENWTARAAPPTLAAVAAVRSSIGLLVGGERSLDVHGAPLGSPLWLSTDGATTWQPIAFAHDLTALTVAGSQRSRVYAGTGVGGAFAVHTSADGGASWTRAARGLGSAEIASIAVHPTKPLEVVVGQPGDGVFRSVDGGATWSPLDAGMVGLNAHGVAYDGADARFLYVAGESGAWRADLASGAPGGSARAYEFYYAPFNHYFSTAEPLEAEALDLGTIGGWIRTGRAVLVEAPDALQRKPVCRFFGVGFAPSSTHFYTPYANECDLLKADPKWIYEGIAFAWRLPDANGRCDLGRKPLYRLYNAASGGAPNHRYTDSLLVVLAMIAQGWLYEGDGRTLVFACVPLQVT